MKYYELTYLIPQEISVEDQKSFSDKLAESISAKQGIVIDIAKPVKKRLAYPIKKQEAAILLSIRFQMEPQSLLVFKDEIQKNQQILRSLIIAYKPQTIAAIPHQPMADLAALEIQIADSQKIFKNETAAPQEKNDRKQKSTSAEKPKAKRGKQKADLKEIGKKLDEILE